MNSINYQNIKAQCIFCGSDIETPKLRVTIKNGPEFDYKFYTAYELLKVIEEIVILKEDN